MGGARFLNTPLGSSSSSNAVIIIEAALAAKANEQNGAASRVRKN